MRNKYGSTTTVIEPLEREARPVVLSEATKNGGNWYDRKISTAEQGECGRPAVRPRPNISKPLSLLPLLLLFDVVGAYANVCTPLNVAANGPHPAVVNGIDALDWGMARVQWRSDAGGTIGSYSISSGGSGYALGDTGTVFGSTTFPATYTVTGVSYGIVTSVRLSANNGYSVDASSPGYYHPAYAGGSQPGLGSGLVISISSVTGAVSATQQRILYATAANWGGNSNASSYPLAQGLSSLQVNDSNTIQGWTLTNLLPSTVYHVLAQSLQSGAWCSANDISFTTPARPTVTPLPVLPQTVDVTVPPMTGTHWVYGSNCGTTAGTTPTIVTANVQDCINKATADLPGAGDDIGFPPGVYPILQVVLPTTPAAIPLACNIAASTCTQSGAAPANGTQITLAQAPSPINAGVPYKVVNSSGSTFRVSLDGVNPITFAAAAAGPYGVYYLPWPITQPYITLHSTAPANLLPPPGVRLGPDAIAQYLPNMPVFEQMDINAQEFTYSFMTDGYYWRNIGFSTDPSVAANGNGLDPAGFRVVFLNTNGTNTNNIFNQCAFIPAPPPSRSVNIIFDGSNVAVVNSYQSGLDWWQPLLSAPNVPTFTSTTLTVPAFDYYWVGAGGSVGTKRDCHYTGGSFTITSGTATGSYDMWVNSDCSLETQLPTGVTATGTNMTITNAATPTFPTFSYTSPMGYTVNPYSVLPFSGGNITAGAITAFFGFGGSGISNQHYESGSGFYSGYGPGPKLFDNDYHTGGGVLGVFSAEDSTTYTSPCGNVHACAEVFNQGNFTETRSTVAANPCFFPDNPCWNGGAYWWRNLTEIKKGKYVYQDGNILGPMYVGVGAGQCALHEAFNDGSIPYFGGYPSYVDSSEWTFTNNTCLQTGVGISDQIWYYAVIPAMPLKNYLWRNNLFYNDNGYAQSSVIAPPGYHFQKTNQNSNCPPGYTTQQGMGMNFTFDHNTIFGQGGCLSLWDFLLEDLPSGVTRSNNVYNIVTDPGTFGFVPTGTAYENGGGPDTPNCAGLYSATLLNCLNTYTLKNNVMLATWTNSFPGSQTDATTSNVSALQAAFGSYAAQNYWPNANTLAERATQIGWFSQPNGNFRLKSSSPYISGAKASTDGFDVGVNMDQLEQHQGKVSNVRAYGSTSTSTTIAFFAPDSFACGVDWGTSSFWSGSGSWTRVNGAGGQRVQSVTLTGLPAHGLIYYRLNCAVQQPTGTVQLP